MRVKGSSASRNKHKKLYSITKGFWGRKKNVYRRAREAYLHALTSAFAGRKNRKRDFRKMWIIRINAAARANGIAYSALINGPQESQHHHQPQDARRPRGERRPGVRPARGEGARGSVRQPGLRAEAVRNCKYTPLTK